MLGLFGLVHPFVAAGKGERVGGLCPHDLACMNLAQQEQQLTRLAFRLRNHLFVHDGHGKLQVARQTIDAFQDAAGKDVVGEQLALGIGQIGPENGDKISQRHLPPPSTVS